MATVSDILSKSYTGKYQQPGYEKELKQDLNTLISAANKRIIKLRSAEQDTGITPGIIRTFESAGKFNAYGKFSSKGVDDPAEILNKIQDLKKFFKAETSTVSGFKRVMIKETKNRIGEKFGWSKYKSQKNISTENIKQFWETFNKLEASAKLKNGVYNFDSERIIKKLWGYSFGRGKDEIDFDKVMMKLEAKVEKEIRAHERRSKEEAAKITNYTGKIRYT